LLLSQHRKIAQVAGQVGTVYKQAANAIDGLVLR